MTASLDTAQHAARNGPFFIVVNAGSGHRDAEEERQTISRIFEESGRAFEFLQCSASEPLDVLAGLAVDLAKARCGVVVAAGGDGTINTVANAVPGSGCPFGVLPQGTFNYFGRDNAISQDTGQRPLPSSTFCDSRTSGLARCWTWPSALLCVSNAQWVFMGSC